MSYYTGSIMAVPTANKQKYIDHLHAAWAIVKNHGALRMVESWSVDIQKGKVTDFYRAVNAKDDEAVVFAWVEWSSRADADNAWQKMQDDPDMQALPPMPYDGGRMIFGGFEPIFTGGSNDDIGYVQGFALAVPEKNKQPYIDMARTAWEEAFKVHGCTGMVEAWGVDVPRGHQTDFYRATKAEDGEVPLFSWTLWPDRTTYNAASRAMEESMEGKEFPEMPFDGMRMMWGGFEPIFDSKSQS